MANQIDDYVKRPIRYKNIDGLGELFTGVLLAACIPFDLIKNVAPSSFYHYWFVVLICAAAVFVAVIYGWRALKARITYPRTGYVKYQLPRARVVAGVLTGVAAVSGTWLVLRFFAHHSFAIAGTALVSAIWGLLYVLLTRMEAAWRWAVLVVLVAAPPAVATLPLSQSWSVTLHDLVPGLVFFVSGAIALALYLRQNPIPEQGAE